MKELCYNIYGDIVKTKNKILFFIVTTVLLGGTIFFVIRNFEKEPEEVEKRATVESINYDDYLKRRSKAYDFETYAILIWNSTEKICHEFLGEIQEAFYGRTSKIYTIDIEGLSVEEFSRVIDDVTKIMGYENPSIIVPFLIVMREGDVVFKTGFMYKEKLMEYLHEKNIE